jgi:hypothetical protein
MDMDSDFVFRDSLAVLSLEKVHISLNSMCVSVGIHPEVMLHTASLCSSALTRLATARSARLRALSFNNTSLSANVLVVSLALVVCGCPGGIAHTRGLWVGW